MEQVLLKHVNHCKYLLFLCYTNINFIMFLYRFIKKCFNVNLISISTISLFKMHRLHVRSCFWWLFSYMNLVELIDKNWLYYYEIIIKDSNHLNSRISATLQWNWRRYKMKVLLKWLEIGFFEKTNDLKHLIFYCWLNYI